METPRPPDQEPTLDQKIEEAWGELGPDRAVLEPEQLSKRIKVQRLAFGTSWILMLPFFIWLMWPWIDDALSSGAGTQNVRLESARARLGEVQSRLKELAGPEGSRDRAESARLKAESRLLRKRIRKFSGHPEDMETRVAIGATGFLIWVLMMALVIRGRGLGRAGDQF